ncbi:DEAD/DEAH box helicase [Candidatus Uhrbacteria bacterium]|nr:DEAD/DEAH box helicase [Candidatus Uhrbacteria bacterium]MBD3284201.1 DEAD/DEAH box helicase [Candidatus Uhrbacteria bacterium]
MTRSVYPSDMNKTTPMEPGFYGLGIAPKLLEILASQGFSQPSPIQHQSIPIALEGKDLIGVAQTGTGKTLAYCVPMIQRLAQVKGMGLIILPTRELALQADETFRQIGSSIRLRTAVVIGGASQHVQVKQLKKHPHVIIATPGRLNDLLEQRLVSLKDVRVLVLDEADRMLDMGFLPQINRILDAVPTDRQTMLFSATMPASILKIAGERMKLPTQVEIARPGTTAEGVTQELYIIPKEEKLELLERLLNENRGSILVFTRTKHGAKKLARSVRDMGHTAAEIHSNRSLSQRKEAIEGFKNGKYRVLVATDIAARGIDVKGIEIVINFDLPEQADDYVHRIGRTARAGSVGRAISFATPDQRRDIRDIERLIQQQLPVSSSPTRSASTRTKTDRATTPRVSRRSDSPRSKRDAGGTNSRHRTARGRSSGSRKPRVHF